MLHSSAAAWCTQFLCCWHWLPKHTPATVLRLPAGALELPPKFEPVVEPVWVPQGAYEAPAVEYSQTGDAHSTPPFLQLDAVQSPQQADAWLQAPPSIHLWWNGRLL